MTFPVIALRQDALEQIEFGTTIHLAFDQLELGDLASV
jgi:hypothetical protein